MTGSGHGGERLALPNQADLMRRIAKGSHLMAVSCDKYRSESC
jgi:hypothetical protein